MRTDDAQITAAACRYLLASLLGRLEKVYPGMVLGMRVDIGADHDAMAVSGKLTPEVKATVAEALRILDLAATP
jgi:hypothetical protein